MAQKLVTPKRSRWELKYTQGDQQLKQILASAIEVFGDESEAKLWLKEPKSALQGKTPLQAINTESGVQQVKLMLGRIEHGIFV